MILEIDEPEADQFFGVKKSVKIPPRHYGITHIQCKDLKEAVMLWVDEELKRKYPSMWADAFYINPFKVSVAVLMPSTANSQVNQTHVDSVPTTSRSEQQPPVAGAQVSMNLITMDIDTGDSPPSAKKPYILLPKHYDWVQQEIGSLEREGVITRSVSPWASPVIMVPEKSAPGEPLRRRMCIIFLHCQCSTT